jgi:prepilin-type N-terminal cleavage/methylation domain-containing protein
MISGKNGKKAFTLIELLVVIAIISLLVSLLLPSLSEARELARQSVCLSNLQKAGVGLSLYVHDNDDYCPSWLVDKNTCHPTNPDRVMPWYTYMYEYFDIPGVAGVEDYFECLDSNLCVDLSLWEKYRKKIGILACPSSNTPKYWVIDYGMNVCLGPASGKDGNYFANHYMYPTNLGYFRPGNIDRPSEIFWLGDSKDYRVDRLGRCAYRHNEGLNLLFISGHAEFYDGELPIYDGSDKDCFPWL